MSAAVGGAIVPVAQGALADRIGVHHALSCPRSATSMSLSMDFMDGNRWSPRDVGRTVPRLFRLCRLHEKLRAGAHEKKVAAECHELRAFVEPKPRFVHGGGSYSKRHTRRLAAIHDVLAAPAPQACARTRSIDPPFNA